MQVIIELQELSDIDKDNFVLSYKKIQSGSLDEWPNFYVSDNRM